MSRCAQSELKSYISIQWVGMFLKNHSYKMEWGPIYPTCEGRINLQEKKKNS